MTDKEMREKVVEGLEWCMNEKHDCYREKGCPYENEGEDIGCKYALHRDALALLKAQEPVRPIIEKNISTGECEDPWGRLFFCGACGKRINEKYNPDDDDKYCKHCGKAVKWE